MHSVLTSRRLTILFTGLFLFQAAALLATLSSSSLIIKVQSEIKHEHALAGVIEQSAEVSAVPENAADSNGETATSITQSASLLSVKVAAGETLALIFNRLEAPRTGALQVDKALREVEGSSNSLRIGETLEILQADEGEVLRLQRTLPDGKIVTVTGDSIQGYSVAVSDVVVIEETKVVSGVIQTSLSSAANSLGLPFAVVDEFVDLFSNRVEFRRDLQPGDTFSVTFAERRNANTGELLPHGTITSASLKNGGNLLVAVQHADETGALRYFDEQGNPLGNYFLRYPLNFSRISSAFSYARFHPVLKRSRPHNGVDFAAPIGTPVRAVADGIVQIASYQGGGGNTIKLSHGTRWATAYLHLKSFAKGIRPGARVSRGQVIGTVGTTGLSTGPHLHFSLYDRGKYVDPLKTSLPAMDEKVKPLPREYLIAALEALSLEHQRVASLSTVASAG